MSPGTLKIAMTVDPEICVPPLLYGGIERVVDMLVRGLISRGHHVTLFANSDSTVPCELVPYSGKSSASRLETFKNMRLVTKTVLCGHFDLIHSHGRLAYLLPLLFRSLPKIMTYQREVSPRSIILGNFLSRETLHFTSVSSHLIRSVERYGQWHIIFNGVPMDKFTFQPFVAPDAPLIFLGRIEHVKGTHLAIEIARKSNRKLLIAGNIEPQHQSYFDEKVKPQIDGKQISYRGPVNDEQKNDLLGRGAALLMPIQYEDPCPVVLFEALACGTPVIGLKRGAIPEVILDGRNGFVNDSLEGMVRSVARLGEISRAACRKIAEDKYSEKTIVDQYESLYFDLVNQKH